MFHDRFAMRFPPLGRNRRPESARRRAKPLRLCQRITALAACVAALALLLAGGKSLAAAQHPMGNPTAAGAHPSVHLVWLLAGSAIDHMAASKGGRMLLAGPLDTPTTWLYGRSRNKPPGATPICGGANTTAAIRAAHKPAHLILLDIEHWRFTPVAEQLHPVAAYRAAYRHVHDRRKLLIATPAFDLIRALRPHFHGRIYPEFLRLGLARKIARYADIYEIQAQGAENNTPLYRWIVRAVARQVHVGNPHAVVLAGLSTGPSGQHVTARKLYQDVRATRRFVGGYWMNIPGKSAYCPRCGKPAPQIAIALFRRLFHK